MHNRPPAYVTYRAVAEMVCACTTLDDLAAVGAWIGRDIAAYPGDYDEEHTQYLRALCGRQRKLLKGELDEITDPQQLLN